MLQLETCNKIQNNDLLASELNDARALVRKREISRVQVYCRQCTHAISVINVIIRYVICIPYNSGSGSGSV